MTTNKYNARRTRFGGVTYASGAEAARAAELEAYRIAGRVRGWVRQVTFRLGCPENRYTVDFVVFDRYGHTWAEDVKGVETATFRRNRKLWAAYGPIELRLLKRHRNGWVTETISGPFRAEKTIDA